MKYLELASLLDRDPVALPKNIVPLEAADRVFDAALGGASLADLANVAGDARFTDGYRRARLADWDFRELLHLVAAGRERLARLDREIGPRASAQNRLAYLLGDPSARSDRKRA